MIGGLGFKVSEAGFFCQYFVNWDPTNSRGASKNLKIFIYELLILTLECCIGLIPDVPPLQFSTLFR